MSFLFWVCGVISASIFFISPKISHKIIALLFGFIGVGLELYSNL